MTSNAEFFVTLTMFHNKKFSLTPKLYAQLVETRIGTCHCLIAAQPNGWPPSHASNWKTDTSLSKDCRETNPGGASAFLRIRTLFLTAAILRALFNRARMAIIVWEAGIVDHCDQSILG
ncbi:hypothetical protein [Parasphingorhabdus halotolerans]|uniref:Uncharacterized protein n=1 Tax=Parasphingorhabdus halotolerans TaxID=2725558 RepID=A0A6H2DKQ9_9SPHN|nr:hypothetical protein [Parasphingorhabdus halotolerans]QJB68535.1 hypothetical protein HF685_03880 [Parasphingorhabdus halotolerans]